MEIDRTTEGMYVKVFTKFINTYCKRFKLVNLKYLGIFDEKLEFEAFSLVMDKNLSISLNLITHEIVGCFDGYTCFHLGILNDYQKIAR